MWVALLQPVRAENLSGGQDPLVVFFRDTSPTAKVVLGILLLFSLISWVIIFAKYIRLARITRHRHDVGDLPALQSPKLLA